MKSAASRCVRSITSKHWNIVPILIVILLTSLISGCAGHNLPKPNPIPTPVNADHTIQLTWSQSFANNGICSATTLTSCISGFTEGYVQGTSNVQLHTDTAAVCTGTTQPEACTSTFNGTVSIGNVVFWVATNYVDQNGVAGSTPPAFSPAVPVAADSATTVKAAILN